MTGAPSTATTSMTEPADSVPAGSATVTAQMPAPELSGAGRMSAGITAAASALGPLATLPGTWTGTGFNLIWRPKHGADDHFLQLNLTSEHLVFNTIGGLVPNRGFAQGDIELTGVRYLQQISDRSGFPPPQGGGALHIEPGFWLSVPATTAPHKPASIVRLGSIPHGASILAQGSAQHIAGAPHIPAIDITPFTIGHPQQKIPFPNESTLSHHSALRTSPLPAGITQRLVNDPNVLLRDHLTHQSVVSTTVLSVATAVITNGGIRDIPFLGPNATAKNFHATFWIETVKHPTGGTFLQLQYSQHLILNFNGLSWPHISVANLVLTGA
jgi:hypothetical protein